MIFNSASILPGIYNLNLNDGYNLKSALRFFSRKIVLETKILRMSDILIVSG